MIGRMIGRRKGRVRRRALLAGTLSTVLAAVIPVPLLPGQLPVTWQDAPTWWPDDGNFATAIGNLQQFIGVLQHSFERLMQWAQMFQQNGTDILTRMIWEAPGQLPAEADLATLVAQIGALPASLRRALEAVRVKLEAPASPGTLDQQHHTYLESNPAMVHEAMGITETDEVVAGGTVQQAAASQAAAVSAAAVSRDLRPQAATAAAAETSDGLTSAGQNLPSSRAGIELLVTGMSATLRQQADLGAATADRLTVLVQQMAQVSQQVAALATTTGALTLRQAERDRAALNARLGLADSVSSVGQALQDTLAAAGDAEIGEPALDPLY